MSNAEKRNAASSGNEGGAPKAGVLGRTSERYSGVDSDAIVLIGPSDRFDLERAVWCSRVMNDRRLDATTRFVAWHLGQRVNRHRGYAWPSTAFLSDLAGVKKRRVQQILTRLAELKIIAREKVGRAFRYRMIDVPGPEATPIRDFPDPTAAADATSIGASAPPPADEESCIQGTSSEGGSRTQGHSISRTEGTSIYLNPDLAEEDDLSDARAGPRAEIDGSRDLFGTQVDPPAASPKPRRPRRTGPPTALELTDFEIWYGGYPRHIGRKDALRAYVVAVRRGVSPELLLERRDAYAAAMRREGRAERHIALPATWLNGERWTDELRAEPDPPSRRQNPRQSMSDRYVARYGRTVLQ